MQSKTSENRKGKEGRNGNTIIRFLYYTWTGIILFESGPW